MKKFLTILLTLILVTSVYSGCAKREVDKKASVTKENSNGSSKEKNKEKEEPVVLEWLAYNSYGQPESDAPIVKEVQDKFNVEFNFWFLDDKNWNDSLNVKLASGDMPDIMRLRGNIPTLVEQGILAEITLDMIKENAPDYYNAVNEYAEDYNVWLYNTNEGKHYALPRLNLNGKYPTVLVWREDWLEAIGYKEPPKTLEEFEDVMYKFRNNDPDGNGKKDTYGLSERTFGAVYGAFGVQGGNPRKDEFSILLMDGVPKICETQPETKKALNYLAKWYDDGVIDPEFVTGENTGGYWGLSQAFMNGRIGVTSEVMYYHYMPAEIKGDEGGVCLREFKTLNPDSEVIMSGPPVGPEGKSGTSGWGIAGEGFGITTNAMKDPKKMEKIWQILNAPYVNEEYDTMIKHGIEGVDYKIENDIIISLHEKAEDGEKRGVSVFIPSMYSSKSAAEVEFADEVAGHYAYIGFPLPQGEAQQKYNATLGTFKQEAFMDIITNEKPVDYFDTFVEEFRNMGGKAVEDEIIAQYQDIMGSK